MFPRMLHAAFLRSVSARARPVRRRDPRPRRRRIAPVHASTSRRTRARCGGIAMKGYSPRTFPALARGDVRFTGRGCGRRARRDPHSAGIPRPLTSATSRRHVTRPRRQQGECTPHERRGRPCSSRHFAQGTRTEQSARGRRRRRHLPLSPSAGVTMENRACWRLGRRAAPSLSGRPAGGGLPRGRARRRSTSRAPAARGGAGLVAASA